MRHPNSRLILPIAIVALVFLAAAIGISGSVSPAVNPESGSGTPAFELAQISEPWLEVQEAVALPPKHLSLADRRILYYSTDSGESWSTLDPIPQINAALYLSASAIAPDNPRHIVIATSYQGLYETFDSGASWTRLNGQPFDAVLAQGAAYYDEVVALWIPPERSNNFLFRLGFTERWFEFDREANTLREMGLEALRTSYPGLPEVYLEDLTVGSDPLETEVWTRRKLPLYPEAWPEPPAFAESRSRSEVLMADSAWQERRRLASDRTGIYLNSWQASASLDQHLDFVVQHGMNSIVVDFKDDFGALTYDSQLSISRQLGSRSPRFDAEELIRKAHEKNIYVIARLVVFKDRYMARYQNARFSLWDSSSNRAWGVYRLVRPEASEEEPEPEPYYEQIEWWADPFSEFVQQYNIAIAQELQELGVDEIQFDYIRFPSDGNTRNIRSRYLSSWETQTLPEGFVDASGKILDPSLLVSGTWAGPGDMANETNMDRVDALTSFLKKARGALEIPIGTDVFGFNGWARMSFLGQDIEALSFYVDVISPMYYPSHFSADFLPQLSYFERAREIYESGTQRARTIIGDRALIRPYVQAFLIGGELRYEFPEYTEYLNLQIRGTMAAGGSGFSMWNNSGRYYMVDRESFLEAWGGGPDETAGDSRLGSADH